MAMLTANGRRELGRKAIGGVVRAVKEKFPSGLGGVETLYIARTARLAYRVETREDRQALVRITVDVDGLRARVDREVGRR